MGVAGLRKEVEGLKAAAAAVVGLAKALLTTGVAVAVLAVQMMLRRNRDM